MGKPLIPRPAWLAGVLMVLALAWASVSTGLVSSNDGSHVALARAIAVRGETSIDPDSQLTLWVDRAVRDRHDYSDRPPGTAFLATLAAWLGERLDPVLLRKSLERGELLVVPAGRRYAETYAVRARGRPPLAAFQGTALTLMMHCAAVGLAGLVAVALLAARLGLGLGGQIVAIVALGAATLWGPYSTMLFSHVTAATLVAWTLVLLELDRERARAWAAVGAGLAGAWAVAADYLLVLAIVPLVVLHAPWRRWLWVAVGATPIVAATLAYHHAAFGSVWSIGYDFQSNFEFARSRAATFDGNPLRGLWTLWGGGRGAGVLVQAPIVLAGVLGLALCRPGRRWLVAFSMWTVVLCFHHTPWGGASLDHRYLIPLLPVVGVGVALAWQRFATGEAVRSRLCAIALVALTALSAALVWSHFWAWRG